MSKFIATRTGLGINPPKEYGDIIQKAFLDVAPKGMNKVNTIMCGSCSVEGAFKFSFISYAKKKRGDL